MRSGFSSRVMAMPTCLPILTRTQVLVEEAGEPEMLRDRLPLGAYCDVQERVVTTNAWQWERMRTSLGVGPKIITFFARGKSPRSRHSSLSPFARHRRGFGETPPGSLAIRRCTGTKHIPVRPA